MASPEYTVFIGGVQSVTWQSLDFTSSLDLTVGTATIQYPDSSTMLSSNGVGSDIQIKRDGVLIWRGLGVAYQKMYDANDAKVYNLICRDAKIYLSREAFSVSGSYYINYGQTTQLATKIIANSGTSNWVNNPDSLYTAFDTIGGGGNVVVAQKTSGIAGTKYFAGYDMGSSGFDITYGYSPSPTGKYSVRFVVEIENEFGGYNWGVVLIDINGNWRQYSFPVTSSAANDIVTVETDINSYDSGVGTNPASFDPTHARYFCFFVSPTSNGNVQSAFQSIGMNIYRKSANAITFLEDLLATQYTAILTMGKTPSGAPVHVVTTINNFKSLQAFQQMIQVSDLECRFNPDYTIDLQVQVGNDVSSTVSFETSLNSGKTEWDYSIENAVNRAVVAGSGSNTLNAQGQVTEIVDNTASQSQIGRWTQIYSFPNVFDSTLLTSYGNAVLSTMTNPTDVYQCAVWDNNTGVAFQVGDTINIADQVLGDTNKYRVFSIHRHYDSFNHESVELVVIRNYKQVNAANWKVQQLQSILNAWAQNQTNLASNLSTTAPSSIANPQTGSYSDTQQNTVTYQQVDVSFQVQDMSGVMSQCVISLTPTLVGGGSITDMFVIDQTSNTLLQHFSNPTSGQQVSVTVTNDILGHSILVEIYVYDSGHVQVNHQLSWSVDLTMVAPS